MIAILLATMLAQNSPAALKARAAIRDIHDR
jgi:hypothetical protein